MPIHTEQKKSLRINNFNTSRVVKIKRNWKNLIFLLVSEQIRDEMFKTEKIIKQTRHK